MGTRSETAATLQPQAAAGVRLLRRACVALATVAMLAGSLPAAAASALVEREYAQAVRSFKAGRISEAFGQFQDLASRGDVDAARVALFLHGYGPVLFGKQWDASPEQIAQWNALVRNSSSASSRPTVDFPPTVLTPTRGKPASGGIRPRAGAVRLASN